MELKESIDLDDATKSPRHEVVREEKGASRILQFITWIFPRTLAVIYFVILFLWIFQAEGGLGNNEANLFGWHALLMSLFIVIFTQEAILSFSSPLISGPFSRNNSRTIDRYFHVSCHALGIICAMLGIVAIVYYKNLSPLPIIYPFYSVYSPHSWLGMAILILWGVQLATGIYVHAIGNPGIDDKFLLAKIHKYLGLVIYVGGLATCALGLQDMQSSDLATSTPLMPGMEDTMGMGQMVIASGNNTVNMTGYYPDSPEAQYSCACTILLFLLGMATFGTLAIK